MQAKERKARSKPASSPTTKSASRPADRPVPPPSPRYGPVMALVAVGGAFLALWRSRRLARRRLVAETAQLVSAPRSLPLVEYRGLILKDARGTTEVDAIIVGHAGVFVVEVKNYNATIFGEEGDETWTASYSDGSSHAFQNPLRQNFRHVRALRESIDIHEDAIIPLVAFPGRCDFVSPVPRGVLLGDYRAAITTDAGIRLTDADVAAVRTVLESFRVTSTREALDAHVAALHERFSAKSVCPQCGAALAKRESRHGQSFLGCTRYPGCRYTRPLP